MICQEDNEKPLTCPLKSKRKDVGSGYSSLAENLIKCNQLGELPFHLERLDNGNGIEMTMMTNSAQYHQSCRLKFNNTKLQRAEKRAQTKDIKEHNTQIEFTHTRSKSTEKIVVKDACFFCGNPPGNSAIYEAATFQVNEHVRVCAVLCCLRTQSCWLN